MTFVQALTFGTARLRGHTCEGSNAEKETELLLMLASGRAKEFFFAHPEGALTKSAEKKFHSLIRRRADHEPLAYIAGNAWFLGREFAVSRQTLIPRPATEMIVEAARAEARRIKAGLVVEVGTGSGCIAVSLAAELPKTPIVATDVSSGALRLARKNAARHKMADRIFFLKGDLLAPAAHYLAKTEKPVIIANLPYIPRGDMRTLTPDVRLFEPRSALDGGKDGLKYYRAIIDWGRIHWNLSPTLIFEILPKQFRSLAAYAKKNLHGSEPVKILNLANITIGMIIRPIKR